MSSKSSTKNVPTEPVNTDTQPDAPELTTAERIDLYLKVLNSKDLAKLPQEQILEMRKRLNPYGRTIAGSDKYLNFSITQITHEYWKKFITTAMIGYLNRMCDEWKVPSGVPVVSVYEYLDNQTIVDTPQIVLDKKNESVMKDYEFNREWMKKRVIVKEFLEEKIQRIEEMRDECQEKIDNMPEQLQTSGSGETLQERIDNLESWIDELNAIDIDIDEDSIREEAFQDNEREDGELKDDYNERIDEIVRDAVQEKIDEYISEMQNTSSNL
jgi:hypothetical protein